MRVAARPDPPAWALAGAAPLTFFTAEGTPTLVGSPRLAIVDPDHAPDDPYALCEVTPRPRPRRPPRPLRGDRIAKT